MRGAQNSKLYPAYRSTLVIQPLFVAGAIVGFLKNSAVASLAKREIWVPLSLVLSDDGTLTASSGAAAADSIFSCC